MQVTLLARSEKRLPRVIIRSVSSLAFVPSDQGCRAGDLAPPMAAARASKPASKPASKSSVTKKIAKPAVKRPVAKKAATAKKPAAAKKAAAKKPAAKKAAASQSRTKKATKKPPSSSSSPGKKMLYAPESGSDVDIAARVKAAIAILNDKPGSALKTQAAVAVLEGVLKVMA